ncbi:MAG TPA: biopolymer transporter ExbD [Pirellulales bacterium]|jgi:biopolymer transport protein ExbD|nr:biopolymer transporter ExbD [Pirellulales bacterium]
MSASISFDDEDGGGPITDINVTPLVDVVLVLLIVFMITVPAIVGSTPVRVDLPETAAAFDPSAEQLPLNIFIKHEAEGKIGLYWNDQQVTEEQFRSRLSEMHPGKDQEVSISADKDIAYDNVVHVMDMLATVGIHKISLPTKHVAK